MAGTSVREDRGDIQGCFTFSRKTKENIDTSNRDSGSPLRTLFRKSFSLRGVPEASGLSLASCSLSRVDQLPQLQPIELDIPFESAHQSSLRSGSIRAPSVSGGSTFGADSEAARALAASRKSAMRKEHMAAIAHFNNYAKTMGALRVPKSAAGKSGTLASDTSSASLDQDQQPTTMQPDEALGAESITGFMAPGQRAGRSQRMSGPQSALSAEDAVSAADALAAGGSSDETLPCSRKTAKANLVLPIGKVTSAKASVPLPGSELSPRLDAAKEASTAPPITGAPSVKLNAAKETSNSPLPGPSPSRKASPRATAPEASNPPPLEGRYSAISSTEHTKAAPTSAPATAQPADLMSEKDETHEELQADLAEVKEPDAGAVAAPAAAELTADIGAVTARTPSAQSSTGAEEVPSISAAELADAGMARAPFAQSQSHRGAEELPAATQAADHAAVQHSAPSPTSSPRTAAEASPAAHVAAIALSAAQPVQGVVQEQQQEPLPGSDDPAEPSSPQAPITPEASRAALVTASDDEATGVASDTGSLCPQAKSAALSAATAANSRGLGPDSSQTQAEAAVSGSTSAAAGSAQLLVTSETQIEPADLSAPLEPLRVANPEPPADDVGPTADPLPQPEEPAHLLAGLHAHPAQQHPVVAAAEEESAAPSTAVAPEPARRSSFTTATAPAMPPANDATGATFVATEVLDYAPLDAPAPEDVAPSTEEKSEQPVESPDIKDAEPAGCAEPAVPSSLSVDSSSLSAAAVAPASAPANGSPRSAQADTAQQAEQPQQPEQISSMPASDLTRSAIDADSQVPQLRESALLGRAAPSAIVEPAAPASAEHARVPSTGFAAAAATALATAMVAAPQAQPQPTMEPQTVMLPHTGLVPQADVASLALQMALSMLAQAALLGAPVNDDWSAILQASQTSSGSVGGSQAGEAAARLAKRQPSFDPLVDHVPRSRRNSPGKRSAASTTSSATVSVAVSPAKQGAVASRSCISTVEAPAAGQSMYPDAEAPSAAAVAATTVAAAAAESAKQAGTARSRDLDEILGKLDSRLANREAGAEERQQVKAADVTRWIDARLEAKLQKMEEKRAKALNIPLTQDDSSDVEAEPERSAQHDEGSKAACTTVSSPAAAAEAGASAAAKGQSPSAQPAAKGQSPPEQPAAEAATPASAATAATAGSKDDAAAAQRGTSRSMRSADSKASARPEGSSPGVHSVRGVVSRENSIDEGIIAEGWIVAGTLMSTAAARKHSTSPGKPDKRTGPAKRTEVCASTPPAACKPEDPLEAELAALKAKPRNEMTPQELGRYLEIKIQLARGRSGADTSRAAAPPATPPQILPSRQTKGSLSARGSQNAAPSQAASRKGSSTQASRPASGGHRPLRPSNGNLSARGSHSTGSAAAAATATSSRHLPAYMRATKSCKAKVDAPPGAAKERATAGRSSAGGRWN